MFEESNLISAWLPMVVRGTLTNKDYWMPKIDEHVVVAYTDQKFGVIMGAIYSKKDEPPVKYEFKRHMLFEDGTSFEYDFKNNLLNIETVGEIHIKCNSKIIVQGDVIADGISLKYHIHPESIGSVTDKPSGNVGG